MLVAKHGDCEGRIDRLVGTGEAGEGERGRTVHFPRSCVHCDEPACVTACPTSIDIPLFIRKIQAHNPGGAGQTILEASSGAT